MKGQLHLTRRFQFAPLLWSPLFKQRNRGRTARRKVTDGEARLRWRGVLTLPVSYADSGVGGVTSRVGACESRTGVRVPACVHVPRAHSRGVLLPTGAECASDWSLAASPHQMSPPQVTGSCQRPFPLTECRPRAALERSECRSESCLLSPSRSLVTGPPGTWAAFGPTGGRFRALFRLPGVPDHSHPTVCTEGCDRRSCARHTSQALRGAGRAGPACC